jgi:hypothetical protein
MQHTCHTVGHECYDNPLLLPVEPTGQSRHRLRTPLPHFSFFKIVLLTKNDTRHVRNTIYLPLSFHKIQQDIMKFIAILVTFVVAFVGSSCAASTEQQHGRKLGKKSAKSAKVENPMNYFSLLSAAQRNFGVAPGGCPASSSTTVGLGNALVTYDSTLTTAELCVLLTYSGLSTTATSATLIDAAGTLIATFVTGDFKPSAAQAGSIVGCLDITTVAQKALLDSGGLFFSIGSTTCVGEIRGQILPTP